MIGLVAVNPADIVQAIETQLVSKGVVGSADAIYWIVEGQLPIAKPTGQNDILLWTPNELVEKKKQIGGGYIGLQLELLIEVHYRSFNAQDRVNTWKDWMVEHRAQRDAILQALENFDPRDVLGNSMTVYNLRIDTTIQPHESRLTKRWGDSVGTWRCHYLPRVTGFVPLG